LHQCCVSRLRDCCDEGCVIVVLQGCVIVLLRARLQGSYWGSYLGSILGVHIGGPYWGSILGVHMGGLNKSDTSIWNKFECVPNGIKSTTFVNWNKFVNFVCYLE
jgi:hypothetical protein